MFGGLDIGFAIGDVEQHEADQVYVRGGGQRFGDGFDRDLGGFVDGVAVGSGGDRGEGKRVNGVIVGQADGFAVAAGQGFGLVLRASAVDGADGVDDVLGWQGGHRW